MKKANSIQQSKPASRPDQVKPAGMPLRSGILAGVPQGPLLVSAHNTQKGV